MTFVCLRIFYTFAANLGALSILHRRCLFHFQIESLNSGLNQMLPMRDANTG